MRGRVSYAFKPGDAMKSLRVVENEEELVAERKLGIRNDSLIWISQQVTCWVKLSMIRRNKKPTCLNHKKWAIIQIWFEDD